MESVSVLQVGVVEPYTLERAFIFVGLAYSLCDRSNCGLHHWPWGCSGNVCGERKTISSSITQSSDNRLKFGSLRVD